MGNALVVPLITMIGKSILKYIENDALEQVEQE